MGQSTNAILFYGILIDHGECECRWYEDEWEKVYAAKMGVVYPTEEWTEETSEDWSKSWKAEREVCKKSPCIIWSHCSSDFPMHYMAVQESHTLAYRGSAQEIHGTEIDPDWRDWLREFCELMDIEWEAPKWYLVSNWC